MWKDNGKAHCQPVPDRVADIELDCGGYSMRVWVKEMLTASYYYGRPDSPYIGYCSAGEDSRKKYKVGNRATIIYKKNGKFFTNNGGWPKRYSESYLMARAADELNKAISKLDPNNLAFVHQHDHKVDMKATTVHQYFKPMYGNKQFKHWMFDEIINYDEFMANYTNNECAITDVDQLTLGSFLDKNLAP